MAHMPRPRSEWPIIAAVLATLALVGTGAGCNTGHSGSLRSSEPTEHPPEAASSTPKIQYLGFQVMTFTPALDGHPEAMTMAGKAMIEQQVKEIVTTIGERGDHVHRQLGFFIGPLTFDMKDEELRTMIDDAFSVAKLNDVAVGFHIDDSMFWNNRKDLWSDKDNVEWSDWNGTIVPHRIIEWAGDGAPILAPPMCYNSAAITAETTRLARDVIGAEIKKNVDHLNALGKAHLFMGVIAGWETRMQDDTHDPAVYYGYCALRHLGYSAANPPPDFDRALQEVVSGWIVLWDKGLEEAGIPGDRIYTHIAFPGHPPSWIPNALRDFYKDSDPDVTAFNAHSNPGFSVYGPDHFPSLHKILAAHRVPSWGVSEGTAVSLPDAFRGGTSSVSFMEEYLAGVFNHGGAYVSLFGWSTRGGDSFAKATTGAPAIRAYQKFLRGEVLTESSPRSVNRISSEDLHDKLQKIQRDVPAWLQAHPDIRSQLAPLIQELDGDLRANHLKEADQTADTILKMIGTK
jgi:hypothetical protein